MRFFILLPCFIFSFMCFYSSASYGSFIYHIDRYTQVGGLTGIDTFVDEFNDGIEPSDGPSGNPTYWTDGTFGSARESDGLLEPKLSDSN